MACRLAKRMGKPLQTTFAAAEEEEKKKKKKARSPPLTVGVWLVMVNSGLERLSLELLSALTSIGPGPVR